MRLPIVPLLIGGVIGYALARPQQSRTIVAQCATVLDSPAQTLVKAATELIKGVKGEAPEPVEAQAEKGTEDGHVT